MNMIASTAALVAVRAMRRAGWQKQLLDQFLIPGGALLVFLVHR
jgi:hypothetical protein